MVTHEDAGNVDDPPFRPIAPSIRLSWLLRKHLLQSVFTAEPDAASIESHFIVPVFGREVVNSRLRAVGFKRDAGLVLTL